MNFGGIYTVWQSDLWWKNSQVVLKSYIILHNCGSRYEFDIFLPLLQKLMDLKDIKL